MALFAGAELFEQVWLFGLAPILGAILAGLVYASGFSAPVLPEEQVREIV